MGSSMTVRPLADCHYTCILINWSVLRQVPKVPELRQSILDEAHATRLSIHPGSNKMYHDLKQRFWWTKMKIEIARYIAKCDTCQKVKAIHLRSAGELQPLPIPA